MKATDQAPRLDELMSMKEVAKATRPTNRQPATPSTVWRWASKGIRGIKLRVTKFGGRTYTTRTWLAEFNLAVNELRQKGAIPMVSPAEVARQTKIRAREKQDAKRELDALVGVSDE